ncbi:MAG: hypothetical protein ACYCPS_05030 [Candidatus Saccharimonadales bacterium]
MNQPTVSYKPSRAPTLWESPLMDPAKRKANHYPRRWAGVIGGTVLSILGVKAAAVMGVNEAKSAAHAISSSVAQDEHGPAQLSSQQKRELTKVYTTKVGDTVWSIASAEGKAVADNPEALFTAENQIQAQIPKADDGVLPTGLEIHLPANSVIGNPVHK